MNICIISSHFPNLDQPGLTDATLFLMPYIHEWRRTGHKVYVIQLTRVYPKLFYGLARITKFFGSNALYKYFCTKETLKENEYTVDGISFRRFVYKKYIPHRPTGKIAISNLSKKVLSYLENKKIDLIVGDCLDPVIFIGHILKKNRRTKYTQIIHNSDYQYFRSVSIKNLYLDVDLWLFRSMPQETSFISQLHKKDIPRHYIFSGIFEKELVNEPIYRRRIKKLLYVGGLVKFKGLETILMALSNSNNIDLLLTVVGTGIDKEYFYKRVFELRIEDRVFFVGAKKREDVFNFYREADALVLVSHETFGMVYVEAMSQACIPIGVKNDGIDGIILDKENGFLVELGNHLQLAKLFDDFGNYNEKDFETISKKAYDTAKKLTCENLAKDLISAFDECLRH